MNVIYKNEGQYIPYETTAKSIIFGDEDLSINLKNRESDDPVTIDICTDRAGELTMGTAAGHRYVAQVEIPPRQYTEEVTEVTSTDENGEETTRSETTRTPVPFDIDRCTLALFALDN